MKIFTLLLAFVSTLSWGFGQNLIENGDFEIPGTSASPVPAPWGGFKNRIINDTTVNSFVGQVENGDGSLFQEFSVTPGETYVVEFDYKWVNSAAANSTMIVRVKDANNLPTNLDLIGGSTANGFALNTTVDQWFDKASFQFVPPTGVDSVRLLFFKANGNKPLNLDSVSVSVFTPCISIDAAFTIADTNGLELQFANQSTGTELTYHWTFGDGDSSLDISPTHAYDTAGTYVVCLQAADSCGTTATVCDTITVFACTNLFAAFAITDTNELEVQFSNESTGTGLTYLWTFGDGNSSMDLSPLHTYDSVGTYVVCLEAMDSCGSVLTVCDTLTLAAASTGIEFAFPYELSLYPNPANESLHLSTTENIDKVEVFNLHGQLLMRQRTRDTQVQLNIGGLSQGIYQVKVYVLDAVGTYRIVKQ